MEEDKNKQAEAADSDSLENPDSGSGDGVIDATSDKPLGGVLSDPDAATRHSQKGFKAKLRRFNIYLILFMFILVIAGGIILVAYFQAKKASQQTTVQTQTLTQNALQQVANTDANVGSNQQVLNVQSSAVFAGKVLVRDSLEVAGNIQIGGTVAISDLTVSGTSSLGQVEVNKNLSVSGDAGLQGSLTVAKSLQVNGSATFSGPVSTPQVTTSKLQLDSDLVLTHHIVAGGTTPTRVNGPALGSGGTASVSGSDTSGTVSINVGSGAAAGCFVTVTFTKKFDNTPHILLTPVGSGAAKIPYYVDRTSSTFSICTADAPSTGSFGYDYFVID